MFDLLKVALRNVGRNRRRSLITAATVFIGFFVIVGTRGLLDGLQGEIRSALTRKAHGDLQLHRAGYQDSIDSSPYKVMFPLDEAIRARIRALPFVEEFSPRVRVMGLLNHQASQSTVPVVIQAFDSGAELKVCPRAATSVPQGAMLDAARERSAAVVDDDLTEAVPLDAAGPAVAAGGPRAPPRAAGFHQVLVTPGLFRGFNAAVGDELVLLVQDPDNMQQAVVATLTGVLDYALPNAQNRMVWMDLATLARTLGLGDAVSEVAIAIRPGTDLERARDELQAAVGDTLIAETYLEVAGMLRDAMRLQNAVFAVVLGIVFIIVIAAIVNTSLMTVMERTREIGTLMALGYKRRHILLLFLAESAAIGLGGGATALALAGGLLSWLGTRGIPFTLPGQTVATVIYPVATASFLALSLLLAVASAVVAAFVPAYGASRMKPVEALSHA